LSGGSRKSRHVETTKSDTAPENHPFFNRKSGIDAYRLEGEPSTHGAGLSLNLGSRTEKDKQRRRTNGFFAWILSRLALSKKKRPSKSQNGKSRRGRKANVLPFPWSCTEEWRCLSCCETEETRRETDETVEKRRAATQQWTDLLRQAVMQCREATARSTKEGKNGCSHPKDGLGTSAPPTRGGTTRAGISIRGILSKKAPKVKSLGSGCKRLGFPPPHGGGSSGQRFR